MLLDVTLWGTKDHCFQQPEYLWCAWQAPNESCFAEGANSWLTSVYSFPCVCFLWTPCSPMGAVKARYTTHSSPPQCCRRHRHHQWPGLCLCPCQTPSLRPHQQKEVQPPPPHRVSMTETKRRLLTMLCAPEFTLKPCPLLCGLQQ